MENEVRLKDSPERIFDMLIELLASLGASKTTIKAVVVLLPEYQQQYKLMEWISKQMETHYSTETEIMDEAIAMHLAKK